MSEMSTRRDRSREARRSRVIEVAMHMALEGGYEAVQMRAVADRADVAIGTIYRYFNGKDDLLIAGLLEWICQVRRRLETEPVAGATAEERLSTVLASAAQSADNAPVLLGALITALSTTDAAAADYKLAVEREIQQLVTIAIGDDHTVDSLGVARVIGHVWLSAISRWVGGLSPPGSVEEELLHAVRMLVGRRVPSEVR